MLSAFILAGPAEAVGRCFGQLAPLTAYRWDLIGSLIGIGLFSLLAFVGGSAATIMSRKELDQPAGSVALALGVIALVATVLGLDPFAETWPQTAIGIGGVERWIAYPVLLWMVLCGTALMGKAPTAER